MSSGLVSSWKKLFFWDHPTFYEWKTHLHRFNEIAGYVFLKIINSFTVVFGVFPLRRTSLSFPRERGKNPQKRVRKSKKTVWVQNSTLAKRPYTTDKHSEVDLKFSFRFLYKSNTLKIKMTNLFLLLTFPPLRWSSREWSSASCVSSHVLQRMSIKSILNMIGWKVRWLIGAYFSIAMITLTYILAHPKPPWPIIGP